jgi:hypothetical protein
MHFKSAILEVKCMKSKIVVAILALVVVGAILFATTAAALNDGDYKTNTASRSTGPYWYGEGEDGYREGGMMNLWGPYSGNSTSYYDDYWGGHR